MTIRECRELEHRVNDYLENVTDNYAILTARGHNVYLTVEPCRGESEGQYMATLNAVAKEFNLRTSEIGYRRDYKGDLECIGSFLIADTGELIFNDKTDVLLYCADSRGFTLTKQVTDIAGDDLWECVATFLKDNPWYAVRAEGQNIVIRREGLSAEQTAETEEVFLWKSEK